jgi:drug/metabolite transporter (DMT)-like permease
MLAIALGLSSGLLWGVGDFLGGTASRRSAALGVAALSQAIGAAAVLLVPAAVGAVPPWGDLAFGLMAGVCGGVGIVAFYRALSVGTMSLVAPVSALGALVPVAYGLASGERPGTVALAGVALAVGGATLAARVPGPAGTRGLGLACLAALGFGGFYAFLAPAAEADALWAVGFARFASVPLLVGLVLLRVMPARVRRGDLPLIAGAGVLDAAANVTYALGTQRGYVSVVAVLGSLYPVTTVALAQVVLRERIGRVQAAGVAAALAGVVLIAAG